MSSGTYFPPDVKAVPIPKARGGTRILGVPTVADRFKGLIAWQEWPVEPWMHTAQVKARVVKHLRAAQPLQAWLDDRVGPSDRSG